MGRPGSWESEHSHSPSSSDESAKFPLRQLELDQGKRRIGPGGSLDQLRKVIGGRPGLVQERETHARLGDDVGHEIGRDRPGEAKLLRQRLETVIVLRIVQHGTISRDSGRL